MSTDTPTTTPTGTRLRDRARTRARAVYDTHLRDRLPRRPVEVTEPRVADIVSVEVRR